MEYLNGKLPRCSRIVSHVLSTIWNGFQTMATENKLARFVQKIGTHSGVFHCDEALACYMLKQLPDYQDAEIIRTRDPEVLRTCDVVVDVGAEYNPKTNRFDHHQKEFTETLSTVRPDLAQNRSIKLSSAGLVYAHFGLEIISELLKREKISLSSRPLSKVYLYVYEKFVEEIDAIDNGVPMYPEGKPRYRIGTNLSCRVGRLNPKWNVPNVTDSLIDQLFQKAVRLTGDEFKEQVIEAATVWWPAREIVQKSFEARHEIHESGDIILLVEHCPWKEHLYSIEEELGLQEQTKFVVFADNANSWRVQGIPVTPDSFVCRVFLHQDWRGVRDDQLSEIAQIPDCIFCHSTGFIGGNKTKEGALKMALKSLKAAQIDRE